MSKRSPTRLRRWLPAGALLLCAALPLSAREEPPPPEPIDCPLCAGDAKMHARLLRTLSRAALDQIAEATARPFAARPARRS
ncbi:MAG: hypothetical protein FJ299_12045 [Planctomycetes bacterium]|nr:hypothetical protein [Planctomycetota bacterium]